MRGRGAMLGVAAGLLTLAPARAQSPTATASASVTFQDPTFRVTSLRAMSFQQPSGAAGVQTVSPGSGDSALLGVTGLDNRDSTVLVPEALAFAGPGGEQTPLVLHGLAPSKTDGGPLSIGGALDAPALPTNAPISTDLPVVVALP